MFPTRESPAEVRWGQQLYLVAKTGSFWFFQLKGHPEAGWTGAGPEFSAHIEGEPSSKYDLEPEVIGSPQSAAKFRTKLKAKITRPKVVLEPPKTGFEDIPGVI